MIKVDINGKSVPVDEAQSLKVLTGRLLRMHAGFLDEALESGLSALYDEVTQALDQLHVPMSSAVLPPGLLTPSSGILPIDDPIGIEPTAAEFLEREKLVAQYRRFVLKFTPAGLAPPGRCEVAWRGGVIDAASWSELFAAIRARLGPP